MRIICNIVTLSNKLTTLNKILNQKIDKTTNIQYDKIYITTYNDKILLSAFNNEITIKAHVQANIIEIGSLTINGILLSELIKKIAFYNTQNTDVELYTSDNKLNIVCGTIENNLQLYSNDNNETNNDYETNPSQNIMKYIDDINNPQYQDYIYLTQKDFKQLIARSLISCATDNVNMALNGIFFKHDKNNLTVVALNGFTMSIQTIKCIYNNEIQFIVSHNILYTISKIFNGDYGIIKVIVNNNQIFICNDDVYVVTNLLNCKYINYQNFIQNNFANKFILNKTNFLNLIDQSSVINKNFVDHVIKLDIQNNDVTISSVSEIGAFKSKINIELVGNECAIYFNSRFIINVLKTLNCENIEFLFNNYCSICLIKECGQNNFKYFIMPSNKLF